MQTTTETQKTNTVKVELGNFGNGRYSPVMAELFSDTQRLLGFSKPQAHAVAARLGIDLGRLGAAVISADNIRIGKTVSKDGYRTVAEVAKIKMPNSWALSVAAICNGLDTLRKQGLEVVECSVNSALLEFVNEAAQRLEEKAS